MANAKIDTGHGASVTFGTSAISWNWLTIQPGTRVRQEVNITHLAASAPLYMAGDLEEPGELVIGFQWDPHGTSSKYSTTTTAETVTVTWPVAAGGSVAATLAGTALVTQVQFPEFQTEEVQTGQMTVKWTGSTPPAFTAGS